MKIGILGAGYIARKMAYTVSQMEDATCYAVAARDMSRAEQFAKKYGIPKAYDSYEEMADDPGVDLIYIATPHSHHYEHAKLCIMRGKPVLCEKPFMANAKQAKEILDLAKEKHVFVTEAIWTRYMPSRKMIDAVIKSGEIGDVVSVTANLGYDLRNVKRLNDPALAGGALLDVGIYPLTFVSMVLGNEILRTTSVCTKTKTGVDAQNSIILKYPDGKLAFAHSSMLEVTEQYGIVYGTNGYLIAENINNVDKIKIYSPGRELVKELAPPAQITGFEDEVRASMKAIREGKIECREIPHEEILYMMKLMDSLREEWGVQYPFEL